jgi:1-acyl-sn-glycerol-3-phosphate acyltransferase
MLAPVRSLLRRPGGRHLKRILDWILTIPFLVGFGLTLVVFEVIARIARLFGLRPMEITMGVMQRALLLVFRINGTRLDVERAPGVLPRTGYIMVSNHQSMFDVPIFGGLLFSNFPKYVAKRELGRWIPAVSFNLTHGGNAVIDRDDPVQSREAIAALGRAAEERNVAVVIFPEGSRSRDGRLRPFRSGGVEELLAAAPSMSVVPVTIDGSWKLLRHKLFPVPFGTRVRVRFSAPIDRSRDETVNRTLERVRDVIESTLEQWRAEDEGNDLHRQH